MAAKPQKYSPEFRGEAARMVVEGSRAIAQVAREYGLSETTLGNWVRSYREAHASDEPPLELWERALLRELERHNRELETENAFLKKRRRTLHGSLGERQIRLHRRRVRHGCCSHHWADVPLASGIAV